MARGWESKAVEAQQAEASEPSTPRPQLSPEDKLKLQKREGLLLQRKRVAQQLERAQNEQYRHMLQQALADLDQRILAL